MKLSIVKKVSMTAFEELLNYGERRQLENTIYRVYVRFAHENEQWVNNLFDFSFLIGNGFDVLAKAAGNDKSASPRDLAQAWADQFGFAAELREHEVEKATAIADKFLEVFLKEFKDVPSDKRKSSRWMPEELNRPVGPMMH